MSKNAKIPASKPLSDISEQDKAKLESSGLFAGGVKNEISNEINPEANSLWRFLNLHSGKIALVVVVFIIAMILSIFYQGHKEDNITQAKLALGQIETMSNPAQQVQALDVLLSDAPKELQVPILLNMAKSYMVLEDYAKAQTAFELVADLEKGTPLESVALLNLANILLKQEKTEEAMANMEMVLTTAPAELHHILYFNIGEIAEYTGNLERAKSAYASALLALPDSSADTAYYQSKLNALGAKN